MHVTGTLAFHTILTLCGGAQGGVGTVFTCHLTMTQGRSCRQADQMRLRQSGHAYSCNNGSKCGMHRLPAPPLAQACVPPYASIRPSKACSSIATWGGTLV